MRAEAKLVRTDAGLVPETDGWFVVNARDARWFHSTTFGSSVGFEGDDGAQFKQLGINIGVLRPGEPACLYHGENAQENFIVLAGECMLIVESEERPLRKWDFVHCPPWVEHVIVGAGDVPCVVLAVGVRPEAFGVADEIRYPPNDVAGVHRASAETEVTKPKDAYAAYERARPGPYREGDLP